MKISKFLLIVLTLLVVYSCKKKKDETSTPDPTPTPTPIPIDYEMLHITKPEWLIYKVDASGTNIWLIPGLIATCTKDDTYRFYKDSIMTSYENADKCSGNPDSSLSNWKFIDGRKKIEANFLGTTDTANVVLLTDTTMNLFVNYNGTDATIFFKKK